jgi:HlyD family secretion protein
MFRKAGFWLALLLVSAAAGGGFLYFKTNAAQAQATEEPNVQTAVVRTGSIVISATGSGSVISAEQVDLGFDKSGRLSELNVAAGDKVKAGDILASLVSTDSATSLALKVSLAELDLLQAQQKLDELKIPEDTTLALAQKEAELAQARVDYLSAQDEVSDAEYVLNSMLNGRGNAQLIAEARAKLVIAKSNLEKMQALYDKTPGDVNEDPQKAQALADLEEARRSYNAAQASVNWYLGEPTEQELAGANANIALAQANAATYLAKILDLQSQIEEIKAGEIDTTEIALAEAGVANAQAELDSAREDQQTQSLVAPFDGTILAVEAHAGEIIGTNPFITLADLNQPMLEVYVDETDLNQIGVGYEVEVVFDALPDQVFTGRITRVDPSLAQENQVLAVRGLAQLDEASFAKPQTLPIGLSASVEVIGSKAENVLLVPVEAVRELSQGSYGVFVMQDGQPKLRVVEVGLMDYTYAEIKSGLNVGDVVTTGIVETGP